MEPSRCTALSGYVHDLIVLSVVMILARLATALIPAAATSGQHNLAHAELAIVVGGNITENRRRAQK